MAIIAACIAVGWMIDASVQGQPTIATRLDWHQGLRCITKMVLLSLPLATGVALLIRREAPTDATGTAVAAGIAAASWGAFVFAFACPHNDPFYIAVRYTLGCGVVTALARPFLPSLTRW